MSGLTPNQWTILEAMKDGPRWARSFQTVKPLLEDLVRRGMVERCRPHLGNARNMVRLTAAGCVAIEIDPDSVPAKREEAAPPAPKSAPLLPIREDCDDKTRRICEAFAESVRRGVTSGEVVGELAALHDVQRPAIWKRLRAGGIIAPYAPRQNGGKGRPTGGGSPGYTARRRERSLAVSEARPEPTADQFVDRDPCPRCGVRHDIGCKHTRAPIGMVL